MATRTARRGIGARAILATLAITAIAAMTVPASAHANTIVDTSVQNGWATVTKMEEFPPGGRAFDPTDPPYQRADGPVEFVIARWARTICQGRITVTSALGTVVGDAGFGVASPIGTYSQDFHSIFPDRTQKLTFPTPLKASGAPYEVTFRAGHLETNGTCFPPVDVVQDFGLDRFISNVPEIHTPEVFFGAPNGVLDDGDPADDVDALNVAIIEPGQPVVVSGKVSDPLTFPDEDRTETSGISEVVIRLYRLDPCAFSSCWGQGEHQGFFAGTRATLIKEYSIPGVCGGVISDGSSSNGLPACEVEATYSQDVTPDLSAGRNYGVTVHALDLAGDLDDERTAQRRSGETEAISFSYLG